MVRTVIGMPGLGHAHAGIHQDERERLPGHCGDIPARAVEGPAGMERDLACHNRFLIHCRLSFRTDCFIAHAALNIRCSARV